MRLGPELLATDLYAVLEVPESATREQIKRAWRRLAMQSHPDLAGSAHEQADKRMARINVAASVLLDPDRRAAYDRQRNVRKAAASAPYWPPVEESPPAWEEPAPERRSWIPNSAELVALLARIRPWSGRAMLELSMATHGWPARRQAIALGVCVMMALSLIVHARPRSLAFLYTKPPALGVASPKGL